LIFLLFSASVLAAATRPVWIDTDPSVAPGGHEVDDALALLQAFGSPEIAIRGVSIVFGNADLPTANRIGRQLVRDFGPSSIRVFEGAAGAADLGRETEASRALAAALRRERLSILTLGPATNVATVVRNHPELSARIVEVIAVAARRPGQRFVAGPKQKLPFRDLNFELDPEAFRVLLASRIPITFAPWEISSKVWLTREDVDAIATHNPGFVSLLPALQDWVALWVSEFGAAGFNPFDTLAVGYLVDPADLACPTMAASIENGGDDTSASTPAPQKPYLLVRPPQRTEHKLVKYCHTAAPNFKVDLLRRIAAGKR
jgi:inosine-uridine nucleoside N-ribohydrolase